jgi:hypothetical protein
MRCHAERGGTYVFLNEQMHRLLTPLGMTTKAICPAQSFRLQ